MKGICSYIACFLNFISSQQEQQNCLCMEKIVAKHKDRIIAMIKIWCCVFSHPDDTKSLAMDVKTDLDENSTRLVLNTKLTQTHQGALLALLLM